MGFRRLTYSFVGLYFLLIAKLGFATSKPSNNAITLQSNDSLPDTHYHGTHASHCSHSSHASHYSYFEGKRNQRSIINVTKATLIDSILVGEPYCNMDSLNCIVKAYRAEVVLSDSSEIRFKGVAIVASIKDDYGDNWRSPRIRVTTHIIPIDNNINIYFSSNGHLGYSGLSSLKANLEIDLNNQLKGDWIYRDKKSWMYDFDENFFKHILQLHF